MPYLNKILPSNHIKQQALDIIKSSTCFSNFILSNKITFGKIINSKPLYSEFINHIKSIQDSIFKSTGFVSIVHAYSCKDADVNQNVQAAPTSRHYIRLTLSDSPQFCAILFIPEDNKVAQTPPHSHLAGIQSISITSQDAIELSVNCKIETSTIPVKITLKSFCYLESNKDLLSKEVGDHIVCFTNINSIKPLIEDLLDVNNKNNDTLNTFLTDCYDSKEFEIVN